MIDVALLFEDAQGSQDELIGQGLFAGDCGNQSLTADRLAARAASSALTQLRQRVGLSGRHRDPIQSQAENQRGFLPYFGFDEQLNY